MRLKASSMRSKYILGTLAILSPLLLSGCKTAKEAINEIYEQAKAQSEAQKNDPAESPVVEHATPYIFDTGSDVENTSESASCSGSGLDFSKCESGGGNFTPLREDLPLDLARKMRVRTITVRPKS